MVLLIYAQVRYRFNSTKAFSCENNFSVDYEQIGSKLEK
jgi:hypothetical protein